MQILVSVTTVSQAVNQPWVAVVSEYDRLVRSEDCIEFFVRHTFRIFATALNLEQVHDVHETNLQLRDLALEQVHSR